MSAAVTFLDVFTQPDSTVGARVEALQTTLTTATFADICMSVKEVILSDNHQALLFLIKQINLFETHVVLYTIHTILTQRQPRFIKETFQALEKVPQREREKLCLDLLAEKLEHNEVLVQVIKLLGVVASAQAISPISEIMTVNNDVDILKQCILALGNIKDTRVIHPLITLAKKTELPSPALAVLINTLGKLVKMYKLPASLFIQFLQYDDTNVRREAIWGLAQYQKPYLYKKMLKHFYQEKEIEVKNEILKNLKVYKSPNNAFFLFDVLLNSEESSEKLLSESSFIALPKILRHRLLRQKLRSRNANVRALACRQIALLKEPKDIAVLFKIVKKDSDENVRAQAAEVLGMYESKAIDDQLYQCVKQDDAILYSAILSICQSVHADKQDLFVQILDQQSEELIPIFHTILSYLPKYFHIYRIQPSMIAVLLKKLQDENINIRYLVVEALGQAGDKSVFPALIDHIKKEEVGEVRKASIEAIKKLIGNDYSYLLKLLQEDPDLLLIILEIINGLEIPMHERQQAFESLFEFSIKYNVLEDFISWISKMEYRESDINIYITIVLNKNIEEKNVHTILDIIHEKELPKLDVPTSELVVRLYLNSSRELQKKICPIFHRSTESVEAVFQLYRREKDRGLKDLLHKALIELSLEQ